MLFIGAVAACLTSVAKIHALLFLCRHCSDGWHSRGFKQSRTTTGWDHASVFLWLRAGWWKQRIWRCSGTKNPINRYTDNKAFHKFLFTIMLCVSEVKEKWPLLKMRNMKNSRKMSCMFCMFCVNTSVFRLHNHILQGSSSPIGMQWIGVGSSRFLYWRGLGHKHAWTFPPSQAQVQGTLPMY